MTRRSTSFSGVFLLVQLSQLSHLPVYMDRVAVHKSGREHITEGMTSAVLLFHVWILCEPNWQSQ